MAPDVIHRVNFINPSWYNLALLIIRHLRKVELNTLYQKKTSSVKQADLRDMFKKATKSGCTSTVLVSPDPLSPTLSPSSAMMTPENTEEDPDDPEPADEGDIQMDTPLISCAAQA
jgi:hypothetical protein